MKKSEIFDIMATEVCRVCEVKREDIIRGRKAQSVVDARMLLVQYLRRIGLSNDDIALIVLREIAGDKDLMPGDEVLKAKAKGVDRLFNGYSARCLESYAFGLMSIEIRDFCHTTYHDFYQSGMKKLPMR